MSENPKIEVRLEVYVDDEELFSHRRGCSDRSRLTSLLRDSYGQAGADLADTWANWWLREQFERRSAT